LDEKTVDIAREAKPNGSATENQGNPLGYAGLRRAQAINRATVAASKTTNLGVTSK